MRTLFLSCWILLTASACSIAYSGQGIPPTPTTPPTSIPTVQPPPTRTPQGAIQINPTDPPSADTDNSTAPINSDCPPPQGWVQYEIQSGDILSQIAARTNVTLQELIDANCIENPDTIFSGTVIYIPTVPEPVGGIPPLGCEPGIVGNEVQAAWEGGACIGISPFESYEGGIVAVAPGSTVTIRWIAPPADATSATFAVNLQSGEVTMGTDTNPADGLSVVWQVPAGADGGRLYGTATLSDGSDVFTSAVPFGWGTP